MRAISIGPCRTCKRSCGRGDSARSALDRGDLGGHHEHVTSDVELPPSQRPDTACPDKQPTAEDKMRTTIIKSVAVSVPVAIGVFVGLVALAVHNQQPDWNAWLSMAVGIGVLAGVFFGLLAGFMRTESVLASATVIDDHRGARAERVSMDKSRGQSPSPDSGVSGDGESVTVSRLLLGRSVERP